MTTIALPILAVVAIVILLILVITLILWRKQSAAQLTALENIEKRLTTVEKALTTRIRQEAAAVSRQNTASIQTGQVQETEPIQKENVNPEPPPAEKHGEYTAEEDKGPEKKQHEPINAPEESSHEPETIQTANIPNIEATEKAEPDVQLTDTLDKGSETPATSIYNIGKSGKIYTKEELELLIKE